MNLWSISMSDWSDSAISDDFQFGQYDRFVSLPVVKEHTIINGKVGYAFLLEYFPFIGENDSTVNSVFRSNTKIRFPHHLTKRKSTYSIFLTAFLSTCSVYTFINQDCFGAFLSKSVKLVNISVTRVSGVWGKSRNFVAEMTGDAPHGEKPETPHYAAAWPPNDETDIQKTTITQVYGCFFQQRIFRIWRIYTMHNAPKGATNKNECWVQPFDSIRCRLRH